MRLFDDYRYTLRLSGADSETLTRFHQAFEKTNLIDYMDQSTEDPSLFTTDVVQGNGGLEESYIEQDLHELACRFPEVKLHFSVQNLADRSYGFELKLEGELFQRADHILKCSDFTPAVPFADRKNVLLEERTRAEKTEALLQSLCSETDFDLLYAQKEALTQTGSDVDIVPPDALHGLNTFLERILTLGETLGRFKPLDRKPNFPLRPDYQKREVHFSAPDTINKAPLKLYALCEEKEDNDAIREFNILALSEDKKGLQKLMQAKIAKDEYGYIAENGIQDNGKEYFSTNYEGGFVEYYITSRDVLTRGDIEQLLKTAAYDPTFYAPDNLQELLISAITAFAAEQGYMGLDPQPVADTLLSDKRFHAFLIREGWTSTSVIQEQSKLHAIHDCKYYLANELDNDPDFFMKTGALGKIVYPDNLRELLLDSIYTVAKKHRLPIQAPDTIANQIMSNPFFQSKCRDLFTNVSHLAKGSELHKTANRYLYYYVRDTMVPDIQKESHPSFAEQIKHAEIIKNNQLQDTHQPNHQQGREEPQQMNPKEPDR